MGIFDNHLSTNAVGGPAWATGISYNVGDIVTFGGQVYVALVANISGTFSTDLANGDWSLQGGALVPGFFGDGSDGSATLNGTNTYPWATLGGTYTFTITSAAVPASAYYASANGNAFVIKADINPGTSLVTFGTGAPAASGTLTLLYASSGTDAPVTITYSAVAASAPEYFAIRSVNLTNLTVSSGIIFNPQSYTIFGTGTLTNAGTIDNSSVNSGNGGVGGQGYCGTGTYNTGDFVSFLQPPLSILAAPELGFGNYGTATVGGTTGAGTAGTQFGGSPTEGTAIGGNSGAGGTGTGGAGGAGATSTNDNQVHFNRVSNILLYGAAIINSGAAGASGGTGGGDGTNNGGGAGGPGGGGGTIALWFNTINNTGTISASGGKGGNGESPTTGNVGGGGGGGGGSGGWIYMIANSWTSVGTMTVTGGALGSAGSGHGTGTAGTAGTAGSAGTILRYSANRGTWF
jgi:hypothetical protein